MNTFKAITAEAATNPAPRLTLENASMSAVYRPDDKRITVYDKTDKFNEPAMYSTNKRNIGKCWTGIVAHFDKLTDMKFNDVRDVMSEHGIRTHYWCRMD